MLSRSIKQHHTPPGTLSLSTALGDIARARKENANHIAATQFNFVGNSFPLNWTRILKEYLTQKNIVVVLCPGYLADTGVSRLENADTEVLEFFATASDFIESQKDGSDLNSRVEQVITKNRHLIQNENRRLVLVIYGSSHFLSKELSLHQIHHLIVYTDQLYLKHMIDYPYDRNLFPDRLRLYHFERDIFDDFIGDLIWDHESTRHFSYLIKIPSPKEHSDAKDRVSLADVVETYCACTR